MQKRVLLSLLGTVLSVFLFGQNLKADNPLAELNQRIFNSSNGSSI